MRLPGLIEIKRSLREMILRCLIPTNSHKQTKFQHNRNTEATPSFFVIADGIEPSAFFHSRQQQHKIQSKL